MKVDKETCCAHQECRKHLSSKYHYSGRPRTLKSVLDEDGVILLDVGLSDAVEGRWICDGCRWKNHHLVEEMNEKKETPGDGIRIGEPRQDPLSSRDAGVVTLVSLVALLQFLIGLIPPGVIEHYEPPTLVNGIFQVAIRVKGKFYTWYSSGFHITSNGKKLFDFHTRIAAAMGITGSTPMATLRVLQVIGIETLAKSSLIERLKSFVRPAVKSLYNKVMSESRSAEFEKAKKEAHKIRIMEDEQFSRVHRQRGVAPWCTAVVITATLGLVIGLAHAQRVNYPGKSLANAAQVIVFSLIALVVPLTVGIDSVGVDGCTTAEKVIRDKLKKFGNALKLGRDNWHKMKDWHKKWKSFVSKPTKAYARTKLRPVLFELFNSGKLHIWKFKKHFLYWANHCGGDEAKFRAGFKSAATHYGKKFGLPKNEISDLMEFLDKELLGKKDLKYYLHGTHTSYCESFHSLCNKLCPKALIKSFEQYCMRKECAVVQWNLKKLSKAGIKTWLESDWRVFVSDESVMRVHGSSLFDLEPPQEPTLGVDAEEIEGDDGEASSGSDDSE